VVSGTDVLGIFRAATRKSLFHSSSNIVLEEGEIGKKKVVSVYGDI
jgi:hypothetical protein